MAGLGRGSRTPFKSMTAWFLTSAKASHKAYSGNERESQQNSPRENRPCTSAPCTSILLASPGLF